MTKEELEQKFPIGVMVEIKPEIREYVFCSYGNGPFEIIGYANPNTGTIIDVICRGKVEIKVPGNQRYFLDPNHIQLVD